MVYYGISYGVLRPPVVMWVIWGFGVQLYRV